ncbi:MAG: AMP-binding protein [Alphaproteobacteria bacterium]
MTLLPLLPLEHRTVPDLLEHSRAFGDDRPFFTDAATNSTITYGEALKLIAGCAQKLSSRFKSGSTVATILSNRPEALILRMALSCAGLTEAAINGEHRGTVLKGMLEIAAPVAIFVEEKFRTAVDESGYPLGEVQCIGESELIKLCQFAVPWEERPKIEVRPSDPCRIIFTSGTSGISKGAELSHAYEVFTGLCYAQRVGLKPTDRWYFVTPYFHIDGILSVAAVLHGGGVFIMARRFSASRYWEEAIATGATVIIYVGSILAILKKRGDPTTGHSVRIAVGVGGTPGLRNWLEDEHGIPMLEIYGLTECAAAAIDDHSNRRSGSCGRPLKGYEIAILDELDRPLAPGKRGQIAIRPTEPLALFSGYRSHPKASLSVFGNLWFHTGDRGSVDKDGYIFYHGRMKDVIRHRDENVSAEELEAIVDTHPSVLISAAVGVASELGDEDILLYVQPKAEVKFDPSALCSYLAQKVAPFMMPTFIQVIGTMPLTPTEKVAKTLLARTVDTSAWKR